MHRLIDANALKKKAAMHGHAVRPLVTAYHMCVSVHDIDDAPTIEVEPVVHGRWVEIPGNWKDIDTGEPLIMNQCSCCGHYFIHAPYNYCPNCGAKMDLP